MIDRRGTRGSPSVFALEEGSRGTAGAAVCYQRYHNGPATTSLGMRTFGRRTGSLWWLAGAITLVIFASAAVVDGIVNRFEYSQMNANTQNTDEPAWVQTVRALKACLQFANFAWCAVIATWIWLAGLVVRRRVRQSVEVG